MNDVFISKIQQQGKEARNQVLLEFSYLSEAQLNWKPSAEKWSVAQCLEHLMISHGSYFEDLKKITDGAYKMSFWERHSPFTRFFGDTLKRQLQAEVRKKMATSKKLRPSSSGLSHEIIEQYCKSLDKFLLFVSKCDRVDIDRVVLTSPLIGLVTYSLRDAFQFLIQHEHRHIGQAIRVKQAEDFPRK